MWWWNAEKHWTPNEPIDEWTTSFPQSYTVPLSDLAKAMRDALDMRRLGREIAAGGAFVFEDFNAAAVAERISRDR